MRSFAAHWLDVAKLRPQEFSITFLIQPNLYLSFGSALPVVCV